MNEPILKPESPARATTRALLVTRLCLVTHCTPGSAGISGGHFVPPASKANPRACISTREWNVNSERNRK
jgi:hypothetical protein